MFANYINHNLDCKKLINLLSKNRFNISCIFLNFLYNWQIKKFRCDAVDKLKDLDMRKN